MSFGVWLTWLSWYHVFGRKSSSLCCPSVEWVYLANWQDVEIVGVIKNKYGIENHWYTKEVRTAYGASVWRNIRAHMHCFVSRIGFQVAMEQRYPSERTTVLDMSHWWYLEENASAFLAQNRENVTWNNNFRRKRSNDWEVYKTAEFFNHLCTFQQLTESEDGINIFQLSKKILLHIWAETYVYKENNKVQNRQKDTSGSILKKGTFETCDLQPLSS